MAAALSARDRSPWWRGAVIYEVYPRSFADADGDGVGDLRGIIERMPYLASLGVDGIWLTPFQPSPQVDQGYDISDYCDIDPLFGTLDDFDGLLSAAHHADIRVLVDIVPNHTSTAHPLFRRAVATASGSPERALFHFATGRGMNHEQPPNNWVSVFGGSAWARDSHQDADDPQWYLHLFSAAQPDWNWENPQVHDDFDAVLRFWFDRGVDGVRIDVAHGLYKHAGLRDSPTVPALTDGLRSNPLVMDQEPVHDVYRRWRRLADDYDPPRLLVGEVNLEPPRAARYTRSDELHQSFAFAFARLGWDAAAWVEVGNELERARAAESSTLTWALENHDLVRTPTRFGGGPLGAQRARAALIALLGLPGAVYVYQGQELGLPEVDVPAGQRADPMWRQGGVSRDGARVPIPWTVSPELDHGFSSHPTEGSWLPVPAGWGAFAVARQSEDTDSTLALFRSATRRRRELTGQGVLDPDATTVWRLRPSGLVECARSDGVSVFIAMGDGPAELPAGDVLLSSIPLGPGQALSAGGTAWSRRTPHATTTPLPSFAGQTHRPVLGVR
ncbi:MAG TPA: alpha-amylase family glycosyl hydrolase [Lacisediminihabitans sp.]|uniref:alpha-amylase family glycosyl hydrolase n=1 Tax=Lacisediminihabitans sp. TaxID=2787631 RepID=UPI002ED9DBB7